MLIIRLRFLIIVCTTLRLSGAQIHVAHKCRDFPAIAHFDVERYQEGTWYEVEGYFGLTDSTDCIKTRYSNFRPENGTFQVDCEGILKLSRKPFLAVTSGTLRPDRSGKYESFTDFRIFTSPGVETDYHTYTIEWSCAPLAVPYSVEGLYIMTRSGTYLPETRELVHQKLRDLGLNLQFLRLRDNTNCPNWGVRESGQEEINQN